MAAMESLSERGNQRLESAREIMVFGGSFVLAGLSWEARAFGGFSGWPLQAKLGASI